MWYRVISLKMDKFLSILLSIIPTTVVFSLPEVSGVVRDNNVRMSNS